MADDLSSSLLTLIDSSIPSFQAAEALLFFAANRDRDFSAEEAVVGMRPRVITVAAVRACAELFTTRRLVTEDGAASDTGPRLQNSNAASVSCRVNTTKDP